MGFWESLISQDSIVSIITSIAATALVALFTYLVRAYRGFDQPENKLESRLISRRQAIIHETVKEKRRRKLKERFRVFFFYAFGLYMVYASLLIPLLFISFGGSELNLGMARFIGSILPDYFVTSSFFQPTILGIAIALYFPILWFSIFLGNMAGAVWDIFFDINLSMLRKFRIGFLCLFSLLLAITVFWLFGSTTFRETAIIVVAGLVMFIALSFSDKK